MTFFFLCLLFFFYSLFHNPVSHEFPFVLFQGIFFFICIVFGVVFFSLSRAYMVIICQTFFFPCDCLLVCKFSSSQVQHSFTKSVLNIHHNTMTKQQSDTKRHSNSNAACITAGQDDGEKKSNLARGTLI